MLSNGASESFRRTLAGRCSVWGKRIDAPCRKKAHQQQKWLQFQSLIMNDILIFVLIDTRVVKSLIHANINYKKQVNPSLTNFEIYLTLQIFNAHSWKSHDQGQVPQSDEHDRKEGWKKPCACNGMCAVSACLLRDFEIFPGIFRQISPPHWTPPH